MILTITMNAALDVTYDVASIRPHTTHRVQQVRARAGGKGVNVASVLHGLGIEVLALGVVAGSTGEAIRRDLDTRGIAHAFVAVAGESRRTLAVVSQADHDATMFAEPGPLLGPEDWNVMVASLRRWLSDEQVDVVVAAGSLPPGIPVDAYARIVQLAHQAGVPVVVDADGPALRAALSARPDVVKPNRAELLASTGSPDLLLGAKSLLAQGAQTVFASDGPAGMTLVSAGGPALRGRLPEPVSGNPTGAGDAAVAAIASGLARGGRWPGVLADALAWSAAAVRSPVAGGLDPRDIDELSSGIRVEEIG